METDSFKNCSGFTDDQIMAVALVRGVTAGVCGAILLLVLVVLLILAIRPKSRDRMSGSVDKRLTIWLTAVTVLAELFLALSLVYYFNPSNVAFCQADGFLTQYFGSVQLLFTLWISLTLFFEVCKASCALKLECMDKTCCGCKIKIPFEVGLYFAMFIVPAIMAIPFTTDSYGPIGPWCWIRSSKENCNEHTAGRTAQIVLWNVPFGLVALLTIALIITALCLLCCLFKKCKPKLGVINSIVILTFLFITLAMCILEVATCDVSIDHYDYGTWVVFTVSAPLGQLAIPLALLVAVHLPLSCKDRKCSTCKGCRKGNRKRFPSEIPTTPKSDRCSQDSETRFVPEHEPTDIACHTAWQSPHSDQIEEERGESIALMDEHEK